MTLEFQPAEPQVRQCLERILASEGFVRSERQSKLLRCLVYRSLEGVEPDERAIGVSAFDRRQGYDHRADPVVRVEAARLRDRLSAYYNATGAADPLVIAIPHGALRPVFRMRADRANRPGPWPRRLVSGLAAIAVVAAGVAWRLHRESERAGKARSSAIALADRAERYARGLEKMPVPEARRIAEEAVAADPAYARAHTILSRVYYKILNERLIDEGRQELRNKAVAAAQEAIRLDPKSDLARSAETFIYSEIDFDLQKAAAS